MLSRSVRLLATHLPYGWIQGIAGLQYRFRHPWLKALLESASRRLRGVDSRMTRGVGRGLRFNAGDSIAGYAIGYPEPELQAALKLLLRPGDTFYDIGANVGFLSVIGAHLVGPTGQVHSFEPVPRNAARIRSNAELNGFSHLQVQQAAVSDREGTASFRVSAFATTGRLEEAGTIHDQVDAIDVPLIRLDTPSDAGTRKPPQVIKIDAEGAEGAILRGAREILTTRRPALVIELHDTNQEVAELLEETDYSPVVLGSRDSILDTHWNARIVALPKEHPERRDLEEEFQAIDLDQSAAR